jgi:hypothetical protein
MSLLTMPAETDKGTGRKVSKKDDTLVSVYHLVTYPL